MTTFRQVLIGASVEDAITGMARRLGAALEAFGRSELYAKHVDPALLGEVGRLEDLPPARSGDVLIYHSSYGEPEVTRTLLERSEHLVLVYHNLTPSRFFLSTAPAVAASLEWGRHELEVLRPRVDLAVAVSAFNAADLRRYGYDHVEELAVGLEPGRLAGVAPDTALARDLADRFPGGYVLSVSQLLPHKRIELLLAAMHLVRWVHQVDLGVVVAGVKRLPSYWQAVDAYARRLNLGRVLFTGAVPDAQLSTLFRRAQVFATTSAHEGLALPPLEAMAFGVPVVASAAGALPDTIGGAGLVLPADAGPALFSEAIVEVAANPVLRNELVGRGFERVETLGAADPVRHFVELIAGIRG